MSDDLADGPTEATFAFVDLAGFTALNEAHGDEEAAKLVDRFEALTRSSLAPGDRLIKTIGDAVFLIFDNPGLALAALIRLLTAAAAEPGFPLPRSGLHHGSAIARGGDVIGNSVNLAARVAGQAHGGQTLGTAAVAGAARAMGVRVVDLGRFDVRNLAERVELYQLDVYPEAAGSAIDPVCRMVVQRADAAGRLRHADTDHWFCSLPCAARFAADPARFVKTAPDQSEGDYPTIS